MTMAEFNEFRMSAITQWEKQRAENFDSIVKLMIDEMNNTISEFAGYFENDIKNIDKDKKFYDYLSGAIYKSLFELVKYQTPAGQDRANDRQRDADIAFKELKILESSIKKFMDKSLDDVNRITGPSRSIKFSKKLLSSIENAASYLESRVGFERRGRRPKPESILIRAVFEALEDGLGRDLARSYRTDGDPKKNEPPTFFLHPDVEIVFRIVKRVFPDVSCNDVTSALKSLDPRDSEKQQ